MYWYVILILAQSPSCATTPNPPSAESALSNHGWWLTSQCEWEQRPCPVARPPDSVVQRLPVGCPAIYPTVAYTTGADLKIRQDFAEANTRIKGLELELTRGRSKLYELTQASITLVEKSDVALTTCVDTAQLQTKALEHAETQLFWSRLVVATSLVAIAALGAYTFAVAD